MNTSTETHLNAEEARAGRKTAFMPWVLGVSFGAATVLAFFGIAALIA